MIDRSEFLPIYFGSFCSKILNFHEVIENGVIYENIDGTSASRIFATYLYSTLTTF